MKYKDGLSKTFTFADPAQTVTGITAAFDAATNSQLVTLAGSGFGTDKTKVTLMIDGKTQTPEALTDTEGKFIVTDLDSEKANVVNVYFEAGLPKDYAKAKTVAVTPNLVSISPSSGSAGGTLLTVTGTGFGSKTKGLMLTDAAGKDVCQTVTFKSYGKFECLTKAEEITKAAMKIKTADGSYACGNTNTPTACEYEQTSASSPTVTGFSATVDTIDVTGTSFPISGYTASVIFKGVESNSASIASATKITATFLKGVPVSKDPAAPTVKFTPTSRRMLSGSANFIQAAAGADVKLTSAPSVSASTTGLECSFQGGCSYEVTGAGLTATLTAAGTKDEIDVCGEPCVIDTAASNHAKVVCSLPLAQTIYSVKNYKVAEPGTMHIGTWTGTADAKEIPKLTDDKNLIDYTDATAECSFQVQYKKDHVGVLDEAKLFINNLLDKTPYVGAKFEGSNDGSAWTTLWTLDDTVHEGWNSKDFEAGS